MSIQKIRFKTTADWFSTTYAFINVYYNRINYVSGTISKNWVFFPRVLFVFIGTFSIITPHSENKLLCHNEILCVVGISYYILVLYLPWRLVGSYLYSIFKSYTFRFFSQLYSALINDEQWWFFFHTDNRIILNRKYTLKSR